MFSKSKIQIKLLVLLVIVFGTVSVFAQKSSPTPTPTPLAVPTNLPVPSPHHKWIPKCPPVGCPLHFTRAEFEIAVNNPSEQMKKGILENIKRNESFVSLADASKKQPVRRQTEKMQGLLAEEYFSSLLSSESTIAIDNEIYRINPDKNLAFVATFTDNAEENSKLYDDLLKENVRNPKIKSYSLEEDVLELVSSRPNSKETYSTEKNKALFCKESGIGSKSATTGWININSSSNMIGNVIFNKFGIYFSLYADLESTLGIYKLVIELQPVRYKARCKSEVGPYNSSSTTNQFKYNRFQSYQGSTNLNKMHLRARFHAYLGNNGTPLKSSDWIEIKTNY